MENECTYMYIVHAYMFVSSKVSLLAEPTAIGTIEIAHQNQHVRHCLLKCPRAEMY